MPVKNFLLTGRPRVGKSILIKRIVERLRAAGFEKMGGFYTLEIRKGGERVGFSITTLDGREGRLAEVGLESPYTLGRYGIDMKEFENVAVAALEDAISEGGLVVIDEIGWMELKSRRFRELVLKAMDSPASLLATIMRAKGEFPDKLKARPDTATIVVRADNRDSLVEEVFEMIRGVVAPPK
jgi:nucleoside-triphosphatase